MAIYFFSVAGSRTYVYGLYEDGTQSDAWIYAAYHDCFHHRYRGLWRFAIHLVYLQLFHANNIGGLDDESFAAMEDVYLFGLDGIGNRQVKIDQKGKKAVAVVFIVIGLYMLWNVAFEVLRGFLGWENPVLKAVYYIMRDDVPRVVIAIAIIWFGTVLLRGKKGVTEVTDDNRNEQMKQITQKDDANPEEHI